MSTAEGSVIEASHSDAVDLAAAVLGSGGSVLLPTDTVYGLAALPTVEGATRQLFELKDRDGSHPVAVLVADVDQALELVDDPSATVARWMATLWPGPLTLVLPRSPAARRLDLGGEDDTIGIRCPDHPFVRALAAQVGPIATTSANRSGDPTPTTAADAAASLVGEVDLVVDGGPAGTLASSVVDACATPWRLLREGAISEDQLRQADEA